MIDEDAEDSAIRAQFCALTYAGCFTASIRFRARIPLISITARNFDHTLFSTASNGTCNHQTIYYPAESDHIFGACDCLRFRNIHKPCEHLSVIALTILFASNPDLAQEIRDQIQEIYPAERYAEPLPAGNDP